MKKILAWAALLSCSLSLQAQQGTLDATFTPGNALDYNGANSIALQPDGKVLVGGGFSKHVARLNSDGSPDLSFSLTGNGFNSYVPGMALQDDGKVVVGGGFTEFNNLPIPGRIARLNSDGSVDLAFKTNLGTGITTDYSSVNTVTIQPDGKILVGGEFDAFNGAMHNNIFRLNESGTLDASFNTGIGFNKAVTCMALQPDGKILVGGNFFLYNGASVPQRLVRLNADGTLDGTFDAGTGFNGTVNDIALQADGKVVVAGFFSSVDGTSKVGIVRLNSDGSIDATFDVGTGLTGAQPFAHGLALQADGKVLLGGQFVTYNGTAINRIARLNTDGSLDASFNAGTGCDQTIWAFAIQPDEKILIVGEFTTYNSTNRNFVARLHGPENIKTAPVTVGNYCQDPAITVDFVLTGTVNAGNIFTAELSDATGSFAAPAAIGTLPGTTSGTINASLPAGLSSGSGYRVRVVSSSPVITGSDNGTDLDIETITPAVITRTANTLATTAAYSTYQWIRNDNPVAGATGITYSVTANGDYKVAVSNVAGCKDTSEVFTVSNVSVHELEDLARQISIYPNPARDHVTIKAPAPVDIRITGLEGKVLLEQRNATTVATEGLPAGLYLLHITDKKGNLVKTEKLVRTR